MSARVRTRESKKSGTLAGCEKRERERTFEGDVLFEGVGQRGKVLEEAEGPVVAVREQAEVGQRSFGCADPAFLLREEVACCSR